MKRSLPIRKRRSKSRPASRALQTNPGDIDGVAGNVSRLFISIYRGWDRFEKRSGGPSIVDFDLAPFGKSHSFRSRLEVLDALKDLEQEIPGEDGSAPFLRGRVGGSIAYLRALMGEAIPFDEYIASTLGTRVGPIPKTDLAAARREVELRLGRFELLYQRKARERFEHQFLLHDRTAVKSGIVDSKDLWLSRLRSFSIPVPAGIKLTVRFASVDEYWANWIAGSRTRGFDLAINLHPRKKYLRGSPLALCLHEICGHAAQMAVWGDRIRKGKLSPACGVTTVHSPENFITEGLGQTSHLLFATKFDLPDELWLRKALQYHELLIMQNAHLKLYAGESLSRALSFADDALPFSHRSDLEKSLRSRLSDPLSRTYQLSYSVAEYRIRKLVAAMDDIQTVRFFARLYQVPMTPAQLLSFGNEILSKS